MLESAQQLKKNDSDYYVISHQQLKVAYVLLCNSQNADSQIFPTKATTGNPITDY